MVDNLGTSVDKLGASQIAQHEVIAQVLKATQPCIEALRGQTLVIKLGGSTLENQRDTLEDIIWLRGLGALPVLVHGGGPDINQWLSRLNIPSQFERGLRVTDAATLEVVRMVLIGKVNSELVRLLGQLGGRAVGLSGIDGLLLRACQLSPEYGFVGSVTAVDSRPIASMCASGYIPVIAPLGLSDSGEVLNINADDAAADVARDLRAARLLYLTDTDGVLDRDGNLLSTLSDARARELIIEGIISGGMIPKVEACLRALDSTGRVHIVDGRKPHVLIRELLTRESGGTTIQRAAARAVRRPRAGSVASGACEVGVDHSTRDELGRFHGDGLLYVN